MIAGSLRLPRAVREWRGRAAGRALLLAAGLVLATDGFAAFSSYTTVSSSLNPSTAVDSVTFTAIARSASFDVRLPAGFGASANQAKYFRYDLSGATFAAAVTPSQLTDVTTGGLQVTIAQAGAVGDSYVVFQVTAGPGGITNSDVMSLVLTTVAVTDPNVAPAVTYSVHETASSVIGPVPTNSTRLVVSGPTALSTFPTTAVPGGSFTFFLDGLAMAGCVAVPAGGASALCVTTIASAGNRMLTVNYSGDPNYTGSTGTLSGGQVVRIAFTTPVLPNGVYLSPYSFPLAVTGNGPNTVFSVGAGGLPVGMTLSASGVLGGTPTAIGSALVVFVAVDGNGAGGARQYSIYIGPTTQTISFSLPPSVYAAGKLALAGTASSGLALSYTVNTPLTCSAGGGFLQFLMPGSCSVTATQIGNAYFIGAPPVTVATTVLPAVGVHEIRARSAAALLMKGSLVSNQIQFTADNDPGPAFRLLGTLDFDGNGTTDLLFQNTTQGTLGDVLVWRDFLAVNSRLLRQVNLAWDVQALGDLDGDGYGDIVWRYKAPGTPDTGVSYVWFSNGTAVGEVRKRGGAPLDWTLLGARDLNGDGAADMVYISPAGQVRVLMATAARSCANFAAGAIPAGFGVLRLADFTGNRRGDILIRNAATGEVRLLALDATGLVLPPSTADPADANASCTATTATIASSPVALPATPANWTYYAAVDFNGDGIADIVWLLPDGSLTLWMMNSGGLAPTVTANAGTAPVGFTVFMP